MEKQVAVILSGSGVFDGSEIHETVLTLLALEKAQISYQSFAPNKAQTEVINHAAGEISQQETRNMLIEANRLSRGNTKALSALNAKEFDALIFVGGFGAAKNLSNFAFEGANYQVLPDIQDCIKQFHAQSKWILAMCIAPVLVAKVLSEPSLTIGSDENTINLLEKATHAKHVKCEVHEHHIDSNNKLITTPAYMLASNLIELNAGISAAIDALVQKI